MLDLNISSISRDLIIFSTIFYFCICISNWGLATNKNLIVSQTRVRWFLFFVLVFSILSWTNGDWYHYLYRMQLADLENTYVTQEDFYNYLTLFVDRNYLLFRLVVWGGALILIYRALLIFKLDAYRVLFFLFAIFINYFDYSRSALGLAVYFFGLSILLKNNRFWNIITGGAIICCAYFFHRSTVGLILLTPLCYFPINRRNIIFIVLAIILSFGSLKGLFINVITDVASGSDDMASKANFYMTQERYDLVTGSFFGMLIGYWKYLAIYLIFAVDSFCIFNEHIYQNIPKYIKSLYNILLGLVILSTLFYFFNVGHMAFYYRYFFMTYFPLSAITVYLYKEGYISPFKYINLILFSGGYVAFEFIYRCFIGS